MTTPKIAVQMDDLARLDQEWDNTLYLVKSALGQNWPVFYYQPKNLCWDGQSLRATGADLSLAGDFVIAGVDKSCVLSDFDIVLIRQDPPFDLGYYTNTLLLEKISGKTLVLNNPSSLRNFPEKIWPLQWPEFIPPTMIGEAFPDFVRFLRTHQKIVIKPLYWMGGKHIHLIESESELVLRLPEILAITRAPMVAQKFLAGIRDGDKRIVLLDGEVVGSFVRGVRPGNFWTVGQELALEHVAELTPRERQICAKIGPALREHNIIYCGLDCIDGYLTEINITSPAGLLELSRYTNTDLGAEFWRRALTKLNS